jgi:hypothetical protein
LSDLGVQNLTDVPLTKGKKLLRLTAENVDTAETLLDAYPEAFIELTLVLNAPLTSTDSKRLAMRENLVSLRTQLTVEETWQFESRKGLSDEALFTTFYQSLYNAEPKEELKDLFLTTLNELQER